MRLTLRTLLAYLDDTLDPAEIKAIGEKVAESDAAQELIARLKQVTRRRRLTVPPASGPDAADPNLVAEYLDNELSADQVAELEKLALESDVHLAEIAACHQILTLILGEPALVPPKAKERMYGLVRGREAIPYRKAQGTRVIDKEDEDEELALSSGWMRWVLPAAGAMLVLLLAVAVYQVLSQSPSGGLQVVSTNSKPTDAEGGVLAKDQGTGQAGEVEKGNTPPAGGGGPEVVQGGVAGQPKPETVEEPDRPAPIPRPAPPSQDSVLVGNYGGGVSGLPATLVSRKDGEPRSRRFLPGNSVFTNDTLVSLPGFTSVVSLKSGVLLTLRGHVPEYTIADVMHFQMEAAVILHATTEFDLDLTLLRGRVYLANVKDKGRVKIRLRFESEVWDVALENKNDEVCVDVARFYNAEINYRADEPARVQCFLTLLRGEADVKIDAFHTHRLEVAPPQSVRMEWDSFKRASTGPIRQQQENLGLRKGPPAPELLPPEVRPLVKSMEAAVLNLEALFNSNKSVEVALRETLQKSDKPESRKLAVYCMAAVDAIGSVLDALDDEDPNHHFERAAAFCALQRWVCRSPQQRRALYDEKTETGLLIDKKYTKREAEGIVQLLHPLSADHAGKVETYQALARYLQHRRRAIAEMSFWHLVWLSPGVKLPPGFNAGAPQAARESYALEIQKMIDKKALPPMRRDN